MSELKRKKGESFEAFLRRVKKGWQLSGTLIQLRKNKYREEKKSKNVQRKQAVNKAKRQSKTAYLQKVGKMPVEENRFGRR